MKTKIGILVLMLFAGFATTKAQQRVYTTTRATSSDISDNLDLDAVSSIFADSKNLEDFEYKLNDPENRISNLDLNNDGYVDYLRVLETSTNNNSLVVIQSVLDKDVYQDVATIEIERRPDGNHQIQVVGDAYIYGANYIIQPVFVRPPLIFSFFWGPRYMVWNSPYYWGYYPRWFSYYRPYPVPKYHRYVSIHIDRHITYTRIPERHFHVTVDKNVYIHRNDYAKRYPDRAFESRHRDVRNRTELMEQRGNNYRGNSGNTGRRPNSDVRSETRTTYPGNNSRTRTGTEIRKPEYKSKPARSQSEQYNRQQSGKKTEYNSRQSQQRVQESQKREQMTRERGNNRMESVQRGSAPKAKSANVQKETRTKSEPRQSSRSTKKAESEKKDNSRGSGRR